MSLARLVITAVSWRAAPRARSPATTASPATGCSSWSTATRPRARPRSSPVAAAALQPARGRPRGRGPDHRGCARSCPSRAWTPARRRSPRTWRTGRRRRPAAGGLDDLADPVPPRVRHPAAAETAPVVVAAGSTPTSPTNAGRPTSPTGASPTAPTSRSSTSSTTTPGSASPATARRSPAPDVVHTFRDAFGRWGIPARCSPTTARSSPAKQRGEGRVALEVELGPSASGSTTPGPTTPRPAARWKEVSDLLCKQWLPI